MQKVKKVTFELCNQHLQALFRAIEQGDLKAIYKIEHRLTRDEECVACAYTLRARGIVKEALDTFLEGEGFVATNSPKTMRAEITYTLLRLSILVAVFLLFINFANYFKTVWIGGHTAQLGAFGLIGAFLLSISTFVAIDEWVLE